MSDYGQPDRNTYRPGEQFTHAQAVYGVTKAGL